MPPTPSIFIQRSHLEARLAWKGENSLQPRRAAVKGKFLIKKRAGKLYYGYTRGGMFLSLKSIEKRLGVGKAKKGGGIGCRGEVIKSKRRKD